MFSFHASLRLQPDDPKKLKTSLKLFFFFFVKMGVRALCLLSVVLFLCGCVDAQTSVEILKTAAGKSHKLS